MGYRPIQLAFAKGNANIAEHLMAANFMRNLTYERPVISLHLLFFILQLRAVDIVHM